MKYKTTAAAMLTLTDSVRLNGFTVFRDVSFAGGQRATTSTFYALPDSPRLALDADGGPAFRFWWYRRTLDPKTIAGSVDPVRAGGLLTVTAALGPTDTERAQLKHDLAAQFQIAGGDAAVNLLPMPFVSGTVALAFAADSGQADFTAQVAGNAPAELAGNEQAVFAVDLTADGAALLAKAIDDKLDVVHVRYDLVFEYHLDDVRMHVWCDARKAQSAAQGQAAAGALDPATLGASLVASQIAGIDITSDTPLPSDRQAALQQLGQQVLDAALAATFVASDGKSVRPFDEASAVTLNHTFTSSFAARQHAVAEAILSLDVTDAVKPTRVVVIDLATEPQPLDVTVLCPIDFSQGPIAAVHFFIAYDGTDPAGQPIHRAEDVAFSAGSGPFRFHTLASADQRSYRWHAEVLYRDGTSATLAEVSGDDPLLILAVDRLGVLDVEATLGDVPLDGVTQVIVDLEYPPRQLSHQLFLDGGHASDTWQAVVGDIQPDALRRRFTFLTGDGRRVAVDWQTGGATRFFVDAPRDLLATSTVQLVSAGDFEDVAQILVDLRSGPAAASTQLQFTAPGQTRTWNPPGSGAALAYQARRTVVDLEGMSHAYDWTDENSPLLVVSDVSRFTVQIISRLLDLGTTWSAAAVAFEHVDSQADLDERDTIVLRDGSTDGRWSFRLGSPDRHEYRYQLTLVPKNGAERKVLPWQDAEDEVLVLRPPAA